MKTEDAIAYYGSRNKLAAAIGVRRQAITQWGDLVPLKQAMLLAEITKRRKKSLVFKPQDYIKRPAKNSGSA